MKQRRELVWAYGAWHLCVLIGGQWVYDGTHAFCCEADGNVITHKLPPKP